MVTVMIVEDERRGEERRKEERRGEERRSVWIHFYVHGLFHLKRKRLTVHLA
jgi:hypothetical protein